MLFSCSFSDEGKKECEKLGQYFIQLFAMTPAEVSCAYIFGDFVVEITECGHLVNKFIAYPGVDGLIDTLRVKGLNLVMYFNRYLQERKVLWFDVDDYEKDGWGEYIDFSIMH